MAIDTGILTEAQDKILGVFKNGFTEIMPDAMSLLGILVTIELALAALFWAIKGEDFIASLIKKLCCKNYIKK